MIDLLLAHGADLAARSEAGLTPLELAEQEEQEKVAAALQPRAG